MKLILLLVLTTIVNKVSSQIIYNPKVSIAYENELKKIPQKIKPIVEDLQNGKGYLGGIVITTFFCRDTLNKEDFIPEDTTIKILDENGKTINIQEEWTIKDMPIKLIFGEVKNDTLNLNITTWFMSEETISHQIIGNRIFTTYNEQYKYDSIILAKDAKNTTNSLTIPVKTNKFILSDSFFTYGKPIYGYAEIETDDFYFLRENNFKNNKIHQRYRLKYYFKIILKKPLE